MFAVVAQRIRASGCGPEGRRFEPCRLHHIFRAMQFVNYNPKKIWHSNKNQKNAGKAQKSNQYKKSWFKLNLNIDFKNFLFFKKKDDSRITSQTKSGLTKSHYPGQNSDNAMKVFAPKTIPDKIKDKVLPTKKQTRSFGFKKIEFLKPNQFSNKISIWRKELKLWLVKIQLFPRLNFLIGTGSLIILLFFFFYLCFFDTNFIIKDYQINFSPGSYLSNQDTIKLITEVKNSKLLGFIPNNQYWFLNSQNLTTVMNKYEKEVIDVKVVDRVWPNKAILEVTTQPILLTLGINNGEYWRISQNGKVLSSDDAALRDKLVIVDRPISLNRSGVTLQNYSFQDDVVQLNRFWFVNWLWKLMDLLQYKVISTNLPSLFDTDVILTLDSGTKLYFDSSALAQDSQKKRIETVLDSKYRTEINLNQVKYFDFRISRRVYICMQNKECATS